MHYDFKKLAEIGWLISVAVVAFVAQALTAANFEDVAADWQTWAIALAAGAGRVAVAAFATALTRLFSS